MERPDEFAAKIFSGASDSKLPSNVADRSLAIRRQWVGAWNGRFRDCKSDGGSADECESSAFAVANAAIKDLTDAEAEKFVYIEGWDVMDVQVGQDEANYNPIGGTDEKACGNCQWYISPNKCVVVQGYPDPINPNGISGLWRERVNPEPDPMPVVIVGTTDTDDPTQETFKVPRKIYAKVKDAVMGLLVGNAPDAVPRQQPFAIYKDADGNQRWFAWATNRWRDRDYPPEIIEDKAHQDFVAYLDGGGIMPEAWLWHTPGTRWGQADWVDYADGFLMVSGTVDPGMEAVAESLAKDTNLGVSHGFRYRHSDPGAGIIGWYRSFELSPLPVGKAANPWTTLEVISKEIEKGMNAQKREWLVSKLGEEKVALIDGDTAKMQAALDEANVDTKGMPPDDDPAQQPVSLSEEATKALVDQAAKAAALAIVETEAFKGMVTAQEKTGEEIKGILERLDGLEKTDDEKLAALITGRRPQKGVVASQDGKTVVNKDDPDYKPSQVEPTVLDTIMDGLEVEVPVS